MTTKHGLITDSFKVVKKARRADKKEQRPPTPPPPPQEQNGDVIACVGRYLHFRNDYLWWGEGDWMLLFEQGLRYSGRRILRSWNSLTWTGGSVLAQVLHLVWPALYQHWHRDFERWDFLSAAALQESLVCRGGREPSCTAWTPPRMSESCCCKQTHRTSMGSSTHTSNYIYTYIYIFTLIYVILTLTIIFTHVRIYKVHVEHFFCRTENFIP